MRDEYPYFKWLLKQIDVRDMDLADSRGYSQLLMAMFDKPFYAVIDGDNYRAEDGEYLRKEYAETTGEAVPEMGECRILEMLIALSQRIEKEIMYDHFYGIRTAEWFWMMVRNLRLIRFDNRHFQQSEVDKILQNFLDREYDQDGSGGLFPCQNEEKDQRKIEIWWQMQRYILDKYSIK